MRFRDTIALFLLLALPVLTHAQFAPLMDGDIENPYTLRIKSIDTSAFPFISMKVKLFNGQRVVRDTAFSGVVVNENGIIQHADLSCPVRPFSVALVLDKSLSMAFFPNEQKVDPDSARWRTAKSALHTFIDQLSPIDRCALLAFARTVSTVQGLSNNYPLINDLLEGIQLDQGTAIWLAVQSAINLLSPRPEAKAIILLTDGTDNSSGSVTMTKVAVLAKKAGIKIFAVGLAEDVSRGVLTALADSTGGKYFFSANGTDLADIYYEITASLVDDCTLTYTTVAECADGTRRDAHLFAAYKTSTVTADTFYVAPDRVQSIGFSLPSQQLSLSRGNDYALLLTASDSLRPGVPVSFTTSITYPSDILAYTGFSTHSFALDGVNVTVTDHGGVLEIVADTSYAPGKGKVLLALYFNAKSLRSAAPGSFSFLTTQFARQCPYVVSTSGASIFVDGNCEKLIMPTGGASLRQNYPNPFNSVTTVMVDATPLSEAQRSNATLRVLDALGNVITTLHQGSLPEGATTLTWDASALPSGVYTLELQRGGIRERRQAVKLR
jgi:Ca-activated chloride channel family protein